MLGTAFSAGRVLMVEQPGGWGIEGLLDSRFDAEVAQQLFLRMRAGGVRVVAIRRPGRGEGPSGPWPQPDPSEQAKRRWAFADSRPGRRALVWGRFAADAELLDLDYDSAIHQELVRLAELELTGPGQTPAEPVYLVCAHGRHDPCCAVNGRPVAAALDSVRPGAVWESSHLGGDRFAANVLALPAGSVYGRVSVDSVEDLAAATDRGEVLVPLLRGQIGMPPVAQAALAFAHRELQLMAVDDLRVLDVDTVARSGPQREETATVRLASPAGVLRVTVAVRQGVRDRLTCRAIRASTPWVYRPLGLEVL
ncbi:MAG: hypothetical protein QOK10_1164 [Pseudonocardiales bacterium]|jgi:hypothetical protein|nr:hypothetical protein [Pseudonocardiales bacterium]